AGDRREDDNRAEASRDRGLARRRGRPWRTVADETRMKSWRWPWRRGKPSVMLRNRRESVSGQHLAAGRTPPFAAGCRSCGATWCGARWGGWLTAWPKLPTCCASCSPPQANPSAWGPPARSWSWAPRCGRASSWKKKSASCGRSLGSYTVNRKNKVNRLLEQARELRGARRWTATARPCRGRPLDDIGAEVEAACPPECLPLLIEVIERMV